MMVTTRTNVLLCAVRSKFYSANNFSLLAASFIDVEPFRCVASVLLNERWETDRYVRCLYTLRRNE